MTKAILFDFDGTLVGISLFLPSFTLRKDRDYAARRRAMLSHSLPRASWPRFPQIDHRSRRRWLFPLLIVYVQPPSHKQAWFGDGLIQSTGCKCIPLLPVTYLRQPCGKIGIRTLETVTRLPHFECGAIDHSAIFPIEIKTCFLLQLINKCRNW